MATPWDSGFEVKYALKGQKYKVMAQSLSKIFLHIVFHIKNTSPAIKTDDLGKIHAYIGQLVNKTGSVNIWVGGIEDHVHVLCLLSRDISVAHLVEELKRNSSRWVKTLDGYYNSFAWQSGYGAFSVSQSVVENTLIYIKNQRQHHQTQSFKDEYLKLLQLYQIEYDEQYIFRD